MQNRDYPTVPMEDSIALAMQIAGCCRTWRNRCRIHDTLWTAEGCPTAVAGASLIEKDRDLTYARAFSEGAIVVRLFTEEGDALFTEGEKSVMASVAAWMERTASEQGQHG